MNFIYRQELKEQRARYLTIFGQARKALAQVHGDEAGEDEYTYLARKSMYLEEMSEAARKIQQINDQLQTE